MKEDIKEVLEQFKYGNYSIEQATNELFDLYNVVLQSEQLKCLCCDGTGIVEGESYDDKQSCLTCSGRGHFN